MRRGAGAEKKKAVHVCHAFAAASASRLALSCARSRLPLRFGLAFAGLSAAATGGAGDAGAGRAAAAGGGEKRAGAGAAIEPVAKGGSKRGRDSGTAAAWAAWPWNGWWGPGWGTWWWNGGGC